MSERLAPYIYRTLRHPSNNVLTHYLEENGVVVFSRTGKLEILHSVKDLCPI